LINALHFSKMNVEDFKLKLLRYKYIIFFKSSLKEQNIIYIINIIQKVIFINIPFVRLIRSNIL